MRLHRLFVALCLVSLSFVLCTHANIEQDLEKLRILQEALSNTTQTTPSSYHAFPTMYLLSASTKEVEGIIDQLLNLTRTVAVFGLKEKNSALAIENYKIAEKYDRNQWCINRIVRDILEGTSPGDGREITLYNFLKAQQNCSTLQPARETFIEILRSRDVHLDDGQVLLINDLKQCNYSTKITKEVTSALNLVDSCIGRSSCYPSPGRSDLFDSEEMDLILEPLIASIVSDQMCHSTSLDKLLANIMAFQPLVRVKCFKSVLDQLKRQDKLYSQQALHLGLRLRETFDGLDWSPFASPYQLNARFALGNIQEDLPFKITDLVWRRNCLIMGPGGYVDVKNEQFDINGMRQLFMSQNGNSFFTLTPSFSWRETANGDEFLDITFTIDSQQFTTRNRLYHGGCVKNCSQRKSSQGLEAALCESECKTRPVFLADAGNSSKAHEIGQWKIFFDRKGVRITTKNTDGGLSSPWDDSTLEVSELSTSMMSLICEY